MIRIHSVWMVSICTSFSNLLCQHSSPNQRLTFLWPPPLSLKYPSCSSQVFSANIPPALSYSLLIVLSSRKQLRGLHCSPGSKDLAPPSPCLCSALSLGLARETLYFLAPRGLISCFLCLGRFFFQIPSYLACFPLLGLCQSSLSKTGFFCLIQVHLSIGILFNVLRSCILSRSFIKTRASWGAWDNFLFLSSLLHLEVLAWELEPSKHSTNIWYRRNPRTVLSYIGKQI